jgi:hypothetical protein
VNKVYELGYGWQEGNQNVRGITMETMIVFHGTPVDTKDEWAVTGDTTTSPAKLIWTNSSWAKTRMLNFKARKITQVDNFPVAPPNLYAQNPDGVGIADVINNVVDVLTAFS